MNPLVNACIRRNVALVGAWILIATGALDAQSATFFAASAGASVHERLDFDADWRFDRFGFMPDGSSRDEPAGLEAPGRDDGGWRRLDLPHDWGIEGPFRPELPNNTGKLPWAGIGWYRKHFTLLESDRGRRIFVDFDGAMSHAKIWLNGELVGQWAYGYSSFRVELTDHLRLGGDNVLAVRLDNPPDSSRWYPGGGIYRNVWLVKTAPVHVAHWGVFVTTPSVSATAARLVVRAAVDNQNMGPGRVTVRHEVFLLSDPGTTVARGRQEDLDIGPEASVESRVQLTVKSPQLWDIDSPVLYGVRTTVERDGQNLDEVVTPFGIRTIAFSPSEGFSLNGRHIRLNGVCDHHDLGPIGAAINVSALERQLQILREMGVNAIRTSHNPPAPELLDLCDHLGFLVMDEAFDCWGVAKTPNDYSRDFADWHERDVRALVLRDRNHPCVILWSSGNEIPEQSRPNGLKTAEALRELFHKEDPTRPVAGALNHVDAVGDGFYRGFDVIGRNYKPMLYAKEHALAPDYAIFGSETASTLSSRGEYFFPLSEDPKAGAVNFQVTSYDLNYPRWATTPDAEFAGQDRNPFVMGEFIWTGFDYLGEPTPYNKDATNLLNFQNEADRTRLLGEMNKLGVNLPSRSSYFGVVDLCGFKKDRFYLYQSRWRPELAMAHILPHWTWPERVGQLTPVQVYTSGDEAELFLNGVSLGRKTKAPFEYRLRWDNVRYEPGEIKVVAYRDGKMWATDSQRTTGKAARIEGAADRAVLHADGKDLAFITIRIEDREGRIVPRAANRVRFRLTGPGEIVAVDNGDATRLESFQAHDCAAFNGLCLVIVRGQRGRLGEIVLHAGADSLQSARVPIASVGDSPGPSARSR